MNIIVKLTASEVETALKNYASTKLSGSKLIPEDVKIVAETGSSRSIGEYGAEVSFKESNNSYYDR